MANEYPVLRLDESGALSTARAELLALGIAEGMEPSKAWIATYGPGALPAKITRPNEGWSGMLRRWLEKQPLFQQRVAALVAERDRLLQDDQWGYATWMINECFRDARTRGDSAQMLEAAKMRLRVAEKTAQVQIPTETPLESAPVGRPVTENPQNRRQMAEIKRSLLTKGMKIEPIQEDEAA